MNQSPDYPTATEARAPDGQTDNRPTLTCVYCGHAYPEGTPPHGAQILTDHIRVCEKHPMRQLELDRAKLRKALVGLVGVDGREDLEKIEGMMRLMKMPDEDKMNTINAVHALRDTL